MESSSANRGMRSGIDAAIEIPLRHPRRLRRAIKTGDHQDEVLFENQDQGISCAMNSGSSRATRGHVATSLRPAASHLPMFGTWNTSDSAGQYTVMFQAASKEKKESSSMAASKPSENRKSGGEHIGDIQRSSKKWSCCCGGRDYPIN